MHASTHQTPSVSPRPPSIEPFVLDLPAIQLRARAHLDEGAVSGGYQGNRLVILKLLNDSLATELVCMLRYRSHHALSASLGGIAGYAVTAELLKHSQEEQAHADMLATRIVQLGGRPDFSPESLAKRSHTTYVVSDSLQDMLVEDLVAERIAVESYSAVIRYIGDSDPTTRRLFETILAQEEEHADEVADFLRRVRVSLAPAKPGVAGVQ